TASATLSAFVSIAFHGTAFAMVLYLVSVGLSVTMGLMGFVNLAHGVFAAAGGYFMTTLMTRYGVPFPLALAGGTIAVAVLAVPLERFLYRPLYGADELDQVLMTMGLVFMSVAVGKFFWGPLAQPFQPPSFLSGQIDLGFRTFPTYRSFLIVSGAVLVTLLWLGVERTRFGARIRAAVDNRRMAQSVGINTSALLARFAGRSSPPCCSAFPIRGSSICCPSSAHSSSMPSPWWFCCGNRADSSDRRDAGPARRRGRRLRAAPSLSRARGAALAFGHWRLFRVSRLSRPRRADCGDGPVRPLGRSRLGLCRHRHAGPCGVFRHGRLYRRLPRCAWRRLAAGGTRRRIGDGRG